MRKSGPILSPHAAEISAAVAGAILLGAAVASWLWFRSRARRPQDFRLPDGHGTPPRADDILVASARGIRPKPLG